jgi:hypothetical protein
MRDARAALSGGSGRLTRRQMMAAIGGGTLLGSAWAALFRHAVLADGDVRVTVARTATSIGALVAHRGHRIMLVHAADGAGIDSVTELATGFMQQRIDSLILPASALQHLPREYRARWRVREIWTVPDLPEPVPQSLAGRSLRIGNLHVAGDFLPQGSWRQDAPAASPWFVVASFSRTRLFLASDGSALARLPLDASKLNAVLCTTTEPPEMLPPGVAILAVPVEAADGVADGPRVVPLSTQTPIAFRLTGDAIELPGAG